MKPLYLLLLLASVATLVGPTVVGLVVTEAEKGRQKDEYLDDGRRYVIVPADSESSLPAGEMSSSANVTSELLAELSDCCATSTDQFGPAPDAIAGQSLEVGERLGWDGAMVHGDTLPNPATHESTTVHVAFLEVAGAITPVVVLDVDPVFVTVDEPEVGRALYRRLAFDAAWTGLYIKYVRQEPDAQVRR